MPSHFGTSEETPPCRSCTSFSDYLKQSKKKYFAESGKSKEHEKTVAAETKMRNDCPLDKDQLGTSTWALLHTMAAKYPEKPTEQQQTDMKQFLNFFSKFYPCETCAADFRIDLKENPAKTESQQELSQWMCRMHNKVNLKLGKAEFDCSKVNERWKDGWLDGSCG